MDGSPELALDGTDTDAEPKALGESHAPTKLNPSQHQEAAERTKAQRSLQTEDVQDSDQRQEGARRTRAWKSLQDPSSLLDTTDAGGKATCVELETQWRLWGLAPRLDESMELALDGPDTDPEPKALESPKPQPNPTPLIARRRQRGPRP